MAHSLFNSVPEMVTPEMKQTLSARLGESPETIQTGLGTSVRMTVNAVSNKASDNNFVNQLLSLVQAASSQNFPESVPSLTSSGLNGDAGEMVDQFQRLVFGAQQTQVPSKLAQEAGLKRTTATALASMGSGLVLSYFSRLESAGLLNVSTMGNVLKGGTIPEETVSGTKAVPERVGAMSTLENREGGDGPGIRKGVLVLVVVAILGAAWMAWSTYHGTNMRSMKRQPVTDAATETAVNSANVVNEAAKSASAAAGMVARTKLPDGSELNVPTGGTESTLVEYLNDSSRGVQPNAWFDLDKVQFDDGSATIQAGSEEQLANIAAILKAYPNVKVRIGGYTESSENKAANVKLSEARAKSVAAALTKDGVAASRLSAKGYGDQRPIEENVTAAGQQANRRVALQVTAK